MLRHYPCVYLINNDENSEVSHYAKTEPWTDLSPPPSANVKNMWRYTFIPPYFVMVCCLTKQQDNFTLCLYPPIEVGELSIQLLCSAIYLDPDI